MGPCTSCCFGCCPSTLSILLSRRIYHLLLLHPHRCLQNLRCHHYHHDSYDNTDRKCCTPSGNSGHVVVSKAWIGKEAIVTLKENRGKGKSRKPAGQLEAGFRQQLFFVVCSSIFFKKYLINVVCQFPRLPAGCCNSQIKDRK